MNLALYFFEFCRTGALGYPVPPTKGSNCTDQCVLESDALPANCRDALRKYTCAFFCSKCDPYYSLSTFSKYYPCQPLCDDIDTLCNPGLSANCKFAFPCSGDSTCTTGAEITLPAKTYAKECGGAQSSAGGQTSTGTPPQTSTGTPPQTSTGTPPQTSTGTPLKSSTGTPLKTSAAQSSGGSYGTKIFVCLVLVFIVILI